mmetsp:Transcript_10346/g.24855  ORF Transcript_10346/g.24855 Transcript_10346/m.24855 type:complete len:122 (-) Transcript_10346:298-663(-)
MKNKVRALLRVLLLRAWVMLMMEIKMIVLCYLCFRSSPSFGNDIRRHILRPKQDTTMNHKNDESNNKDKGLHLGGDKDWCCHRCWWLQHRHGLGKLLFFFCSALVDLTCYRETMMLMRSES